MKTPREILLAKHAGMARQLDGVRQKVVKGLEESQPPTQSTFRLWDFLYSLRWHVAGASALWMLALLLNAEGPSTSSQNFAAKKTVTTRQVLASLHEQRRQLLSWEEESTGTSEPVELPKALPRSENKSTNTTFVV